eukprot:703163-Hanusia_phi.AAC.2
MAISSACVTTFCGTPAIVYGTYGLLPGVYCTLKHCSEPDVNSGTAEFVLYANLVTAKLSSDRERLEPVHTKQRIPCCCRQPAHKLSEATPEFRGLANFYHRFVATACDDLRASHGFAKTNAMSLHLD